MASPKVSIIIPTYNRIKYLPQAIESARCQDYHNLEIVVSDNNSTDNTRDFMKKYSTDNRIRYFRNNTNMGMVGNWRRAIYDYSSGDWFLILSDDDYLIDNNYISKAVNLIDSADNIVIVYANSNIIDESINETTKLQLPFNDIEDGKKIFLSRDTIKPIDFTLCNVLFNRKLAMSLEPFKNNHNLSSDSELFLKMCLYGKVGVIRDFVSVYRIHSNNLIKTVFSSFDTFINNIYLLEPYKLSKTLNVLSDTEMKKLEDKLVLIIRGNLMFAALYYRNNYSDAFSFFQNKVPWLLDKAMSDSKFKLKLFIAKKSKYAYKIIKSIFSIFQIKTANYYPIPNKLTPNCNMPDKVGVIIVNWNGKHFLRDCLPSLLKQTYPNYQVWVVDNGSTDDSVNFVKQSFPSINLISLSKNMGFAYANNIAILNILKDKNIKYIALLNNDTVVDSHWLEELVKEMDNNSKIGICASKMLSMDNPNIIDSTGHVFGKRGILIDRGIGETDKKQYDNAKYVIGACAGACLYRRKMLEKIGLFDESFVSYYEDAELSWRAYRKGWKSRFVSTSVVYHKRSGTLKTLDSFHYKEIFRIGSNNIIATIKRHGSFIHKLLYSSYLIKIIIIESIKMVAIKIGYTPHSPSFETKPYWNALVELWG